MAHTEPDPEDEKTPVGAGGWIVIAALIALLAGAVVIAERTWFALGDTTISPLGWMFLSLGVVVSVAVGAGLMWLLYYSNRKNFDQ